MAWNYTYTDSVLPSVITSVFLLLLAAYSWRHRSMPGAVPFAIGCLFSLPVAIGIGLQHAAVDVADKVYWAKVESYWLMPAVTAITCFILEYAMPGRWMTRRNILLLCVVPFVALLVFVTDGLHQLAWTGYVYDGVVTLVRGPAAWFFMLYSLALILINVLVYIWLFAHSPQHRIPVIIMFSAQIGARALFLLDASIRDTWLFYVPIAAVPFIGYAIALFGFRIFDPIFRARQIVSEQLRDGMIVLDAQEHIVNLNPAAERMLHTALRHVKGHPIGEVIPAYRVHTGNDPCSTEFELNLTSGQAMQHLDVRMSELTDWRGQSIGKLLLLHDVTARKQADAALRESQEIRRLIFENASDGISIFDENSDTGTRRILEFNERYAQMSGRSRKELQEIGDPALLQMPLAPVPFAKPRTDLLAAQSEGFFSWVRPDGRQNIIEYRAASFRVGGRLLTIGMDRDVTERQQTELKIVEQQRSLAILQEREQLARELHDSLGQVFAFIYTQSQTIRYLLEQGDIAKADTYVGRLVEVARESNVDIRESILGLRVSFVEHGFFPALKQYLKQYERNYGITTEFMKPDALPDELFEPLVEGQLLRILQEALTNARKHARANNVRVAFACEDRSVYAQVTVQDDGKGFDPSKHTASNEHIGLRVMRERAEYVGGSLNLNSTPGQGTVVVVSVPVKVYLAV